MEMNPELNTVIETSQDVKTKKDDIFEKRDELRINFNKCVKGYHMVNSLHINETRWKGINATLLISSGVEIYSNSDGGNSSGMDINSSLGKLRSKSAKYSTNKKSIEISSYRLTTVCSGKHSGTPAEIIEEINRRKIFDYYSLIVRDESDSETISYDWLLIPSNYFMLDPSSYTWEPTIGKKGKNAEQQIGWKTNEINGCKMTITFSMSSQLWIHLEMSDEIKQFIISTATVQKKQKCNYIELLDKLSRV